MKPSAVMLISGGLLAAGLVLDVVDWFTRTGAFSWAAAWVVLIGLVVGLAAVPALAMAALRAPPGQRMRPVALGLAQGAVLALFASAWWMREGDGDVPVLAVNLEAAGALVAAAVTWWCSSGYAREPEALAAGAPADSAPPDAPGAPDSTLPPAAKAAFARAIERPERRHARQRAMRTGAGR